MNLQEAATRLLKLHEEGKLTRQFRLINLGVVGAGHAMKREVAPGEGAPDDFDISYEQLDELGSIGAVKIENVHKTVTKTRTVGKLRPREHSESHQQLIGYEITLVLGKLRSFSKPLVESDTLLKLEDGQLNYLEIRRDYNLPPYLSVYTYEDRNKMNAMFNLTNETIDKLVDGLNLLKLRNK